MRRSSHWRDISKPQLWGMLGVLKDMDGPATVGDLRRELEKRGVTIEAIPTVVWEIGQNPGYSTSGGVRFPDGKWRYWLLKAPGWTPRWMVTENFEVVPYREHAPLVGIDTETEKRRGDAGTRGNSFEGDEERRETTRGEEDINTAKAGKQESGVSSPESGENHRSCLACGHPIGPDGQPFCDEDCKTVFFGGVVKKGTV